MPADDTQAELALTERVARELQRLGLRSHVAHLREYYAAVREACQARPLRHGSASILVARRAATRYAAGKSGAMGKLIDIYGGRNPWDVPTYTIPMAARYLRLPVPTLRSWVKGYKYKTADGLKQAPHVISPPVVRSHGRAYLSFTNLVEAHVLASIRRVHEVPLPTVRRSLKEFGQRFGTPHPLALEKFATNGVDIFVEKFGELINLSNTEQKQLRRAIVSGLKRIEYVDGLAQRLFPFSRAADQETSDQPRIIVIDPMMSFGRPVISGTGVPISEIAERFKAGDSVEHLAEEFRIGAEKVQEALRAAA